MTTGTLAELRLHLGAKSFRELIAYIEQIKLNPAAVSEWVFFQDEQLVKAIALNKSNYNEGVKEYHKSYTDLHITLAGQDTMYTGIDVLETIEDYNENGDYALVLAPTLNAGIIPPGHFVIIPPNELHANQLEGDSPLKVVIKLKP